MNATARTTLLAVLAAIAACDRPRDLPDMGVSRDSLSFEAPGGSGDPQPQAIYIVNTGRGSLARPTATVAYQEGSGWLASTVSDGGAPYLVSVQPSTAGLAPGVYRATLTLACTNASASPAQVNVTLTVPDPSFDLSAASLEFVAPSAGDPAPKTFQVLNGGRGILPVPQVEVSYVGTAGWLTATVTGTPDAYTVTVAPHVLGGLESGIHAATLSIGATGVSGPPRTLAVSFALVADLAVSRNDVQLWAPLYVSELEPYLVTVTNAGRGAIAPPVATVTSGAQWLSAGIFGTSEPYTLALTARHGQALDTGWYSGAVRVATADESSVETVNVTFFVPPPFMMFSPAEVSWTEYAGCPLPGARMVGISNTGAGRLAPPTATVPVDAASWLAAAVTPVHGGYRLTLTVTAPPPVAPGSSIATSVRLDAPGAERREVPVVYSSLAPAISGTSVAPNPLPIHAQAGLGDSWPATLAVRTEGGCIAPPSVSVSYAPGDPAWLSTDVATSIGRHDVLVRASAAGMSAGDDRTATLHVDATGLSQDVQVTLAIAKLRTTGAMSVAREGHAVVALPDGRALAIGGFDDSTVYSSVELYDPATGLWSGYAPLNQPRRKHGAVVLDDGQVLVCGGVANYVTPFLTCEVKGSSANWLVTGSLQRPHDNPTLIPLPSRKVLVVGGEGRYTGDFGIWAPTDAEILDLATGTSSYVTDVAGDRVSGTTAVELPSGEVLVAGGWGGATWLYDPAGGVLLSGTMDGVWLPSGTMALERIAAALVALPDGRVLAAAGFTPQGDSLNFVRAAETWDPQTGLWSPAGETPYYHYARDFVLATSGKVVAFSSLVAGGGVRSGVDVLDVQTGSWSEVPGFDGAATWFGAPVRLASGMILLVGGRSNAAGGPTTETFIW